MKKLELHWQIMIGMVLGVAFGYAMTFWSYGAQFISDWIAPFGTLSSTYKCNFLGADNKQ
ncbi:hypothetical protein ACQ1P7_10190 [Ornithobacterium rhinotracheale]